MGVEGGLRGDQVDIDNIGERKTFEPFNARSAHVHLNERLFLGASIARTERALTDIELFADGPHVRRSSSKWAARTSTPRRASTPS